MEALFSAASGELVSRCISFLINKYATLSPQSKVESLHRLERMLLRVFVTVEEAEGRRITNQAMLGQLNMLREEMYKGQYLLDIFRYLAHEEGKAKDHEMRCSLDLSTFNAGKYLPICASSTQGKNKLKQMLDSVENIVTDMDEFVVSLKNCPPIFRQPYSMHLFLERCMFGRQTEMERVVDFLLQEEPHGEHNLGVLPIVGEGKVGKSTLVEHVCCDARVRDHFSQIVFFGGDKFREEKLCTLRDGGITKYQSSVLNEEKLLVVIELDGDINEGAWRRLFSASQIRIPRGSKIIITSRSEEITRFGTTQALRLNFLSRDASWYFFKVLVFGSTVPEEHPKLASIAMEIFEEFFDLDVFKDFTGPFANAKNIADCLTANVSTQQWRRVLASVKGWRQNNQLPSSAGPGDTRVEKTHFYLRRSSAQYCVLDSHNRVGFAQEEVPKITMEEVMSGSATPQGKFDVVVWKSHLPPYYSYITSCEIRESNRMLMSNKRCNKRKSLS